MGGPAKTAVDAQLLVVQEWHARYRSRSRAAAGSPSAAASGRITFVRRQDATTWRFSTALAWMPTAAGPTVALESVVAYALLERSA